MGKSGLQYRIKLASEGEQRRSSEIGPDPLLVFEIELLDVISISSDKEEKNSDSEEMLPCK